MRRPGLLVFLLLVATLRAAPPAWLIQASRTPAPSSLDQPADAVVLLDEQAINVRSDGRFEIRLRRALRILTSAGCKQAVARVAYDASSSKIRSFKAWVLRPDGSDVPLDKQRIVDVAVFANALELYSEARARVALGENEGTAGAIFGYEAEIDERSVLSQRAWGFQGPLPIARSAVSVTLPRGWNVESHTFNHPPVAAAIAGATRTWELRDQPAFKPEPLGPSLEGAAPWLALDFFPPPDSRPAAVRRSFASWNDVSSYLTPFYDAATTADSTMIARVSALTRDATPWEKITRFCRLTQEVNYISIQLDTAHAGGAIPRPAPRVFHCNYGDCKDKATLLRALLRIAGIDAWAVAVFSGDRHRVRPEWPSTLQFNHCILAIRVDASVTAPAVIEHPTLGRLLIFDPTDRDTPPGLLPASDEGGTGLLIAGGEAGGLVTLPGFSTDLRRIERSIHAEIFPDSSLKATIEENFTGASSPAVRSEWRRHPASEYRTLIASWLAQTLPAPTLTRLEPRDDFLAARFTLAVDLKVRRYAKPMRDKLLVFKPVLVARRTNALFREKSRRTPVVFEPAHYVEHAEFVLPAGFHVDEVPSPVALTSSFGRYAAEAAQVDGKLVFTRSLELHATTVPASDYDEVRVFFEKIVQTEQTPVVLQRSEDPPPSF